MEKSNILGDYDPTSMSAHFPPDLETIPGFENDLFPFSSLGQVGSQATSGGGGGGTEAASSSFGGYAGQTHAYQAYADASFVPLTGLPSEGTKQRSGGYSSSEYHEAVAGLPGFLESPRTTFLHDGPSSQADASVFASSAASASQARQTSGRARGATAADPSAMFEGAPSVVYSTGAGDSGNGNGNGNGGGGRTSSPKKRSWGEAAELEPNQANILLYPKTELDPAASASGRGSAAGGAAARAAAASIPSSEIFGIHLISSDKMQCRFAVKNDEKETNQAIDFVQRNGYVEYKARYCKKRGGHVGYGYFRVGVLPTTRCIYPFLRQEDPAAAYKAAPAPDDDGMLIKSHDVRVEDLARVEITVRLYQSFRGCFPAQLVKFAEEEVYHPLYVDSWQDATLLKSTSWQLPGLSVVEDPDGEWIKYVTQDKEVLAGLRREEGIRFPCPVPSHPERLNDIGMLRMQVNMKFIYKGGAHEASPVANDYHAWIKLKVVQQLSGKKRKFADMLREPSKEWSLPPVPERVPVKVPAEIAIPHVLGKDVFKGQASMDLLLSLVNEVASRDKLTRDEGAIHIACKTGNLGLVRMMLQVELSLIHKRTASGDTPLHVASGHGHLSIVECLFQAGARLHDLNFQSETPETIARQMGHVRIADKMHAWHQREQTVGCDDVFRAAAIGRIKCLRKFVEAGKPLNYTNPEGQTPLMLATLNNHPLAVSLLVSGKADVSIRDRQGNTALHLAAAYGFVNIVIMLAHHDMGCLSEVGQHGRSPLHWAALNGQALAIQALLSFGASTTAEDAECRTPVDLAVLSHNTGSQYLLTAHDALGQMTHPPATDMFNTSRAGGSLVAASQSGDMLLVRQLLACGNRPNHPDADFSTPIKHAAQQGHLLVLDELLTWHMQSLPTTPLELHNINVLASDGYSPMHAACSSGFIGCLLVLLSSKIVDLNLRGCNGNTPLHICAEVGRPVCAAFLLMAGAHRSLLNEAGETPVDVAVRTGNSAAEQVLQISVKSLLEVSQMLEQKPGASSRRRATGSSKTTTNLDDIFSWRGMDEVLSRIWHGTHSIRKAISATRGTLQAASAAPTGPSGPSRGSKSSRVAGRSANSSTSSM